MKARLDRLERAIGQQSEPERCRECGHPSPSPEMRVTFAGADDPGPEHCPACGRRIVFTVVFDTSDEGEE